jgi:hypothetical protein
MSTAKLHEVIGAIRLNFLPQKASGLQHGFRITEFIDELH